MVSARTWMLARAQRRNAPSLDLALLTQRGLRYASTRLTLPVGRAILRAALHGAELWLLGGIMPYQFLIPLFAMRAAPALLHGLHWGALEGLRERVRYDGLSSRQSRATAATEAWLTLSLGASILLAGSVFALVWTQSSEELGPSGLYGAFALVVSWSLALELWARTFHSGIFALGRVYRPGFSVVLPDLTELGCLLLLWMYIGPFALHVGVLLTAFLRTGLGVHYGARAYRARGLSVPAVFRLRALRHFGWADLKAGSLGALSSLPLQLDRLLLLTLLGTAAPATLLPLSAPYYALRPVAGLAQSWVRVFYADLVRLNHSGTGMLRARFERLLFHVAAWMALVSCLLLGVGSYLLFQLDGLWASLWFLPLAVVRGLFAVQQVRAFVFGSHARLIATGVAVGAGLAGSLALTLSDRMTLLVLSAVLLLSLLGFRGVESNRPELRLTRSKRVALSTWLAAISRESRPLRISVGRIDASICSTGAATSALAQALPEGQVARSGRAWVLWWEPVSSALPRPSLVKAAGYSLAELRHAQADTGAKTLRRALEQHILPSELSRALEATSESDPLAALEQARADLMPSALRIRLEDSDPKLSSASTRDLIRIRRAILASAREQHNVPRWARWQAATFAPAGESSVAFVWTSNQGAGGPLKRAVLHASWRASAKLSPPHAESAPDRLEKTPATRN